MSNKFMRKPKLSADDLSIAVNKHKEENKEDYKVTLNNLLRIAQNKSNDPKEMMAAVKAAELLCGLAGLTVEPIKVVVVDKAKRQ
jgi:hypothetical protein